MISPIVLTVLGLFVVLLTGCRTETQSQPAPVVKSSSSVLVQSSSSEAETIVDSAVVDSVTTDTAVVDTTTK